MAAKTWLGVIGLGLLTWTVGCGETPTAPTASGIGSREVSGTSSGATLDTAAASPTVTLQADLTADPAIVTVPAGSQVLFVNNSGRYVTIHSYNCTEFSLLRLASGYSRWTAYFTPAGKTCDYFAWDVNWSRKIFTGQVVVLP